MDLSSKFWSPLIWILEKMNRDPYEHMNPKDYRILGTYDQMARIPRNRLTYYYLLIGQEIMALLNEVYYVDRYVKPSEELNRKYLVLLESLNKLQNLKYNQDELFDFKKYPDLFQFNSTLKDIEEVRNKYPSPHFNTELQIDLRGGVTTGLPDDLENLFKETHELLADFKHKKNIKSQNKVSAHVFELPKTFHWDKTGKEYILDGKHKIIFTVKNSKKLKLFTMLINGDGDWVNKKDIIRVLKVKTDDVRSMISQLRKDIKSYQSDKIIWIDTNNNGSYKLTFKQ